MEHKPQCQGVLSRDNPGISVRRADAAPMTPHSHARRAGEQSFSLFETMIAIGMLAVVMLQVSSIQGQVVYSLEYGQNLSKGIWLAKGLVAKLEYEWATRDFSELELALVDQKIQDPLWGEGAASLYQDFSYDLTSREWKLPLLGFLAGGEGGAGGTSGAGASPLVAEQLKAVFGDHVMKIATVEVYWPEGARRASTSLSMLLVNQKALDTQIMTMSSPGAAPTSELKDQFTDAKQDQAGAAVVDPRGEDDADAAGGAPGDKAEPATRQRAAGAAGEASRRGSGDDVGDVEDAVEDEQ